MKDRWIMQNGHSYHISAAHPEFPEAATILSYVTQGQKEQSWNPETEAHMVLNKLGVKTEKKRISFRWNRKNAWHLQPFS